MLIVVLFKDKMYDARLHLDTGEGKRSIPGPASLRDNNEFKANLGG